MNPATSNCRQQWKARRAEIELLAERAEKKATLLNAFPSLQTRLCAVPTVLAAEVILRSSSCAASLSGGSSNAAVLCLASHPASSPF